MASNIHCISELFNRTAYTLVWKMGRLAARGPRIRGVDILVTGPKLPPICTWGGKRKLAPGVGYFSSEDWYHAGQVAFIRMATEPNWDYYAAIYSD